MTPTVGPMPFQIGKENLAVTSYAHTPDRKKKMFQIYCMTILIGCEAVDELQDFVAKPFMP